MEGFSPLSPALPTVASSHFIMNGAALLASPISGIVPTTVIRSIGALLNSCDCRFVDGLPPAEVTHDCVEDRRMAQDEVVAEAPRILHNGMRRHAS